MATLPDGAPIARLDQAAIGRCFMHVLAASAGAGHAHISNTARDYFHEAEDEWSESAFVYDAFMLRPSDAVAKWFGSQLAASYYLGCALEEFINEISYSAGENGPPSQGERVG